MDKLSVSATQDDIIMAVNRLSDTVNRISNETIRVVRIEGNSVYINIGGRTFRITAEVVS